MLRASSYQASVKRCVRDFHITTICSSQLKIKLDRLQKKDLIVHRTEKENKRLQIAEQSKIQQRKKYGYSANKATKILRDKYAMKDLDSGMKLGPESDSDTNILASVKDKRLMYNILGVTRPQLKDSVLVAKDVQKFCKREQLQKALYLIKLAGPNGVVGMNILMQHYLQVEKDGNSAIDLYTYRKKWQIPPNEYTESILFNGLAHLPDPISIKTAERVLKIVSAMAQNDRLNTINFNAALTALANCKNPNFLFSCFELRPKGIKKDTITYTQLLIGCTRVEDPIEAIRRADDVMNMAAPKLIDSQMFFHYANVWHSRKDQRFVDCVLPLFKNFCDFELSETSIKVKVPDFVTLPTLETWSLKSKVRLDGHNVHLILENCLKTKQFQLGVSFFDKYCRDTSRFCTNKNILTTMELIEKMYPAECGDKCRELFSSLENKGLIREPLPLIIGTYRAFERQALKQVNNRDPARAVSLVRSCFEFMKEHESQTVSEESCTNKYLKWKPWMFLWKIIAPCKEVLPPTEKKVILSELIQTILYDNSMFQRQRGSNAASMRFVLLEAVRFVKSFETEFKLTEEQLAQVMIEPDEPASILKRKFLFSRLLLRFRKMLLTIVDNLESNRSSDNEEVIQQFSKNFSLILHTNIEEF